MSWLNDRLENEDKKKRGGTRKIADLPREEICRHPEHNPPNMMVFEPGIYEHTCPGCGHTQRFVVNSPPSLKAM